MLKFFFSLLCQIASLLSDASSILTECMGSFAEPEELKTLLDTHKDLNQLEDIGELLSILRTHSQIIDEFNSLVIFFFFFLVFRFLYC